jgi:hypothetical protein
MLEMELNKIVIDEKRHDQLIVLKEKNGKCKKYPISMMSKSRFTLLARGRSQ